MNACPGAEESERTNGTAGSGKSPVRRRLARLIEPVVPRQTRRRAARHQGVRSLPGAAGELAPGDTASEISFEVSFEAASPDPLEHPDPVCAADSAGAEALLRCWAREMDLTAPEGGTLRIPLYATGVALLVPVRHWSATGWHRFGRPVLERGGRTAAEDAGPDIPANLASTASASADALPVDAVTLAALLVRESSHRARASTGAVVAPGEGASAHRADLVGRVADSVQRTAEFLHDRRAAAQPSADVGPFLDAEQSLLLGHPLHPTPKSRAGFTDSESRAYSPELRAAFPLHWIAVDRGVLAGDSAWTEDGRPVTAEELALRAAGEKLAGRVPVGTVPLPLHPWQAREVWQRPAFARLLRAGLVQDLGLAGEPWHPTSSVRTVVRADAPAMLKLSLGVRITNSRRENLRKELLRGVEVHRLLRAGLGARWRSAHPGFDIVRDPAWLGVDDPEDRLPLSGLDTVIRDHPFGAGDDAVCVAGLLSPHPGFDTNGPEGALSSRLERIVRRLAARTGRSVPQVSAEWFERYLDRVVRPVLWLDAHAGIALEAHQQNTLVLLDSEGWPCGGRYRDNQGYYFRTSRRTELERRLPGAALGVASDSFVDDAVVDERFAYYLGINNVLGLVGALGAARLADERALLGELRRFLRTEAHGARDEPVSPLPALLLASPTLRCKANLLTRVHGLDELVGPVDTQSVYVSLRNPVAGTDG